MKNRLIRNFGIILVILFTSISLHSQELQTVKMLGYNSVRDQGMSGTCWCFSMISIFESELIRQGIDHPDLSELFIVRNIYLEKAKNYILRQGFARFDEGAFGHDVFVAMTKYGIVPDKEYSIYKNGPVNHMGIVPVLKNFLDSVLADVPKGKPISLEWEKNYIRLLDSKFGTPPEKFTYNGKEYTPVSFSQEVLKFNPDDYIGLTSFTHHPFYKPFNVEVPDNYSGGLFYNIPVDELLKVAKDAVMNGYTVGWDADVSNPYFKQKSGFAMNPKNKSSLSDPINPDDDEVSYTQQSRQELFESLVTQDDHLMHIVGLKKSPNGKEFFWVKNSWGKTGPFEGFLNVSETYFGINTITLVLPVSALSSELRTKLGK